ncbi:MAG TPA: YggT family protein [Micrococcales bacterium]|uniref:YggT family protein n=1 Tax=Miniimonas arenae TaxID=676201 RepID=A0A5C5BH43_9MICO|nr:MULTISPECIES: YggT family protein [Miniimonas]TNU77373.1 YggT family protein [Miniimonas arenae]HCX83903.1 YggT family protein [Micrococcales bacterium]
MTLLATIAYVVVLLFVVALLVRVVYDVVQMVAREWRPRGLALVAAEAVYTTTDPPLRLVRRWVPPLRLGAVALDLAFLIVMFVAWILLQVLGVLATR